MAWKGGIYCQKCLEEDIQKNIPVLKRRVQDVNCPIHGHPAALSPHLKAWVDFFTVILPHATPQTGQLPHVLIKNICDDYDIRFTEAFYWLNFIREEVLKRDASKN